MKPNSPTSICVGSFPGIVLRGVGLRRGHTTILQDINWSVPAGACAAILGPNGSGKSTLARILSSYCWPTTGDVEVLGRRFGQANLLELRRSIRMVQAAGPYDVDLSQSTRQAVLTGYFSTMALYDPVTETMEQDADRLICEVGLSAVAGHPYSTLSSGERVRALIARAMVHKPGLLLLDEPTAGLDLLAREQVLATVQAMCQSPQRPTVVMITHHVEELPPATSHILLLDGGRVGASGATPEVLKAEVLSRVYRCPLEVRVSNGRTYVEVHPGSWDGLLGKIGGVRR